MSNHFLYNKYKIFLKDISEQLTKSCPLPINLNDICARLGISIKRSNIQDAMALGVYTKKGFEIRLQSRLSNYVSFERYIIAHEMGHFILNDKFNAVQLNKGDYWYHEELCDYFARSLLLPENYVKKKIEELLGSVYELYELSLDLSKSLLVNWKTSAHRIVDYNNNIAFFEITRKKKNNRLIFFFKMSTLPKRVMQKTEISPIKDEESYIYDVFSNILNGHERLYNFGAAFFKNPNLYRKFPYLREVKNGIAVRVTKDIFCLVVMFECPITTYAQQDA